MSAKSKWQTWQTWQACRQCQSPIFPPRWPRKRTGHLGRLGRLARRPIYYILGEERRILSAARRGMNVVVIFLLSRPKPTSPLAGIIVIFPFFPQRDVSRSIAARAPAACAAKSRPLPEIQRSLTPYATCGCLDSAAPRARLSHRCLRRVGGSRTAR